nr:hypothetical protein [Tanacetum cinerariifolium]
MSTQQDIYAAGSESRPHMLNKENYVPWSSYLLRYAKSRPNGKLIYNSILNGPYVRRMIPEPGDANRKVTVTETFHVQTEDELYDKELKQIEADDQAIQTILLGLPEDIYATVDSWESIESYYHRFLKLMNDLKRNKHFPEKIASNLKFLNNLQPEWSRHVTIVHQTKDLNTADYTQLYDFLKYNQKEMVGENGGNQFRQYAGQNAGNLAGYNEVIGNQIRCYNCRGVGHYARNCTIRPRRRDATYLQTQLLIAQKEEAGIQLQTKEYDLMAAAADINEIEEVNAAKEKGCYLSSDTVIDCSKGRGRNPTSNKRYTELLEPIPESHQVPQNDNNVISKATSMEQAATPATTEPSTPTGVTTLSTATNTNAIFVAASPRCHTTPPLPTTTTQPLPPSTPSPQTHPLHHHPAAYTTTPLMLPPNTTPTISVAAAVPPPATPKKGVRLVHYKNERGYCLGGSHRPKRGVVREAAKFVRDFKSLTNEANASLAKHKALELEIKRLLKAVVSQDIMIIVQNESVVDTSDLQTELERTKERFENCIIKKENKYAKLWNDWYKKCDKCKYEKILYDKAYKDMQQKIERLQAQLGDLKDNTHDTSENTKFAKQLIMENLPNVGETHALSKPVTSNSVSTPPESKGVNNDKVIAPVMFRINPFKTSKDEKHVPNTVRESDKKKPTTVSQPPIITKKDVNSDISGLSSTGVDNIKTRRPQPRTNTKHDRDVISKVVCAMCKKCLISVNHDECLRNYVNGKNSRGKKQKAKVCFKENQMKYQPKVTKPKKVIQIFLWCVDSGCSKHMTGNLKLLINFVWKFMGTVRFRNDHVAVILGFGDIQWGNILITRVYFVEGLGHNLFSVGQFCDLDLEVVFRRNACFVRNLEGVDLLKGDRSTNLYTINLHEMASASPICLMARASSTKSWLWHQRLSHLNFDTINDLVSGLLKFKYYKEHLCPSCEQGKSKRASHPPKPVPNSRQRLHLLHMDLCRPMRIASINGKRTDNGTEFKNQVLKEYFDTVGISHQMSSVRTPQQNGVVERRNRTLVEAARIMLIFSHAPLFFWAEAITTAALCYPKNDREDIGKLGAKGDIGFFIKYSADSCAYRIYNRRTKKIMETMNVSFDELLAIDFEQRSSKPRLQTTRRTVLPAQEPQVRQSSMTSTTIADTAPTPTNSSSHATNIPITSQDVNELNSNAMVDGNTFVNPFANSSTSTAASSSSPNVDPSNMHTFYQP